MGRLVNVIGVRPPKFSKWPIQSNWGTKAAIGHLDYYNFIQVFFSSKKVQSFGFLLNKFEIKQAKSGITFHMNLLDTQSGVLSRENLNNWESNYINKVINTKPNIIRLILLEKLLLLSLQKLGLKGCKVEFTFCSVDSITAYLICNYIKVRLKQQYTLGSIVYPLARFLNSISKDNFEGFKIDCNGRFSRRQRASSFSLKEGRLPFSSRNLFLDYAFSEVILKFGKCGLKVWLFSKEKKASKKKVKVYSQNFIKI